MCGILNIGLLHCVCVGVSLGFLFLGVSLLGVCVRLTQRTSSIRNATHLKLQGEEATRKAGRAIRRC